MRSQVEAQKQVPFTETTILFLVRLKDYKAKVVGIGGR
jgi:hypothetical protein